MNLLQENGFNVKGFVARLEFLTLEYAFKKGIVKNNKYTLVANATNENLHYSLYRQDGELFTSVSSKTLDGLGVDLRSRALVEQVIEIINVSAHIISTEEEVKEEHLYLSRFANEWIKSLDHSSKNIPTPLGWVNFKKQLGNKYPVTVLKADIDERTSVIIDDIVTEMIKLLDENNIQHHEVNSILFIGDTFDNGQFKKSLSQHIALSDESFIHFHEKELGDIVNVYHELPSEWFDDDEERFATLSEAEKASALAAKKQKEELEAARKKDEEEFLRHQQETERDRNLQAAITSAQDAEKKMQYDEALGLYKTAFAIDTSNTYISQKIDELTGTITELKSKKKQYEEYIHNARIAYDSKEWNNSVAQSMLALGVMPDSCDAKQLLDDAKSMATKYARLKECLSQIDFYIEKSAFAEAQHEIKNAELLNLKDPSIEERRRKIAVEIQRIQCSINELKAKLDIAVNQEDFDLAVSICSELLNIDISNKQNWESKKEHLIGLKEQRKATLDQLRDIRKQIDENHLAQNWVELQSLCKAYLVIKYDDYIKELYSKAEEKLIANKVSALIDKVNSLVANSEIIQAISILDEAIEIAPDDTNVVSLRNSCIQKQKEISKNVELIKQQISNKESEFEYKEAIELCNQLVRIDVGNKSKWLEELQRLQSLQIEKSDLELNFRRKKADLKVLVREGNVSDDAEEKILSMQIKYHGMGIRNHDQEFLELLIKANPNKYSKRITKDETKPQEADKKQNIRKYTNKSKCVKKKDSDNSTAEQKSKEKELTEQNNNEGFRLLKSKQYIAAKRYFATKEKNNPAYSELPSICTELIVLEKKRSSGTCSVKELQRLKELCDNFGIN